MIYINLGFIVLNTYLAATAQSGFLIALNSVAVALNVMAVAVQLP